MAKKNVVDVYGKKFHLTPRGRILPRGKKHNLFTGCVTKELVLNEHRMLRLQDRPDGFAPADIQHNRNLFKLAVYDCQNKLWPDKYPMKGAARAKAEAAPKVPAK